MKQTYKILVLLCVVFVQNAWCDVKLPNFVGNGMVLQRDVRLPIWGWANPGEKITVRFETQVKTTKTSKDGSWRIYLDAVQAGGPYVMTIQGKNSLTLKNILVGDVFLASGQSNMEFTTYSVKNSREEIAKADFPDIHYFRATLNVSNKPIDTLGGEWKVVSPETVSNLSGVAYFFAKELYQKKKIPIGLIVSAWGGSVAESWTNAEALQSFPDFKEKIDGLSTGQDWHTTFIEYEKNLKAFNESAEGVKLGVNATEFNDSDWKSATYPFDLKGFGVADSYGNNIWIRKEIQLDTDFGSASLFLGKINGDVNLYVNGVEIKQRKDNAEGASFQIPDGVLKSGSNLLAIKFHEVWSGNLGNPEQKVTLQNGTGKTKFIDGEWKYNTTIEKVIPPYVSCNYTPTTIFNAMIAPLIPYAIKGVIWYQGESNADRALQYRSLFPALIEGWRKKWGYDFPFLFVQLANYMEDKKEPADYQWAALREAQQMALKVPKTAMAVTIDIGDANNIHPTNKQDVGKRLALAAEKCIYGNNQVVYSGPTFKNFSVENGKVKVQFSNTGSGLAVKDKYGYVRGFAIAGEDKVFKWANGYQLGNTLVLYNESIKKPVAIRYDWGNSPDGNLYNKEGLPAVPFRTDDYPLNFK